MINLSGEESQSVRRLFDKGVVIPPQPRVLCELQDQIAKGVADVRVLARTIGQDPGIAAMLFKIVQSAVYKPYQPFSSLEDILQAVGLKQTGNLVTAIALTQAVPAKHNRKAFESYWARSKAVAELAMLIAEERVAVCNIFPDQAYLAGLFHDCGVPVLMQRFSTYCKTMCLDEPGRWVDLSLEDARFNADHCVIGYLVARHWKLPDFICEAIRCHHDIRRLDFHAARTMAAILQLAIHLYYEELHLDNPEWSGVHDEVLEELGLSGESLPELCDVIRERYHAGEVA